MASDELCAELNRVQIEKLKEGLPSSVRIGAHDYSLEFMDRQAADQRIHGNFGMIDRNHHRIFVDRSWSPRKTMETILHEALHACYYEWELQEGDDEERIVAALGKALVAAIRDNQGLFKALLERLA